jgi:hypothetical protein
VHRTAVVLVLALLAVTGTGAAIWRAGLFADASTVDPLPVRGGDPADLADSANPAGSPEPSQPPGPARLAGPVGAAPLPAGSGPARSAGQRAFTFADSAGPVVGTAGRLRRFRVAVENGTGQGPAGFAAIVDRILGDPRSWIASGKLRLQRVPKTAPANFTIYLVSAASSEAMCAAGGLRTNRYTSCRLPGQVVINLDRWLGAIPGYGAPLDVYRAYAINHEVGHELGYGHQSCPGAGQPAPVMQQQTYGLKGCAANGWPYLNGVEYSGPPIS